MKQIFLALSTALVLTSCAGVHVTKTEVATGATEPAAIYIRPFDISEAGFKGHHSNTAEHPIRKSLVPAELAGDLQEEFSKTAPARVLKDNEMPKLGWLVEGEFEYVHAGSPLLRSLMLPIGAGRSKVIIHVRVIDVEHHARISSGKETASPSQGGGTSEGQIIYEFDVAGGSSISGVLGTTNAPGLGYATSFDLRNAAERIATALTTDAHRYGFRSSPTIR